MSEVKVIDKQDVAVSNVITPMSLLQMASEQGADLDRMQQLMDMSIAWEKNEAKKAYVKAMAIFRAECPTIDKDSTVKYGQTSFKHATIAGTLEQIKYLLGKCGLSHSWTTSQDQNAIKVTCTITHEQGHSESTSLSSQADSSGAKNSIQAIGSTVTYLQRYTLFSILGLASADNDGAQADEKFFDGDVVAAFQEASSKQVLRSIWSLLSKEQQNKYRKDLEVRIGEIDA